MARIRDDYVLGTLDAPLLSADTTLMSSALARLAVVAAGDVAAVTVFDRDTGDYEIVHITSHLSGATDAVVQRGAEGTLPRDWGQGATWNHGPTAADLAGTYRGLWAPGSYPANALVTHERRMWAATQENATEPPLVETQIGPLTDTNVWKRNNVTSAGADSLTLLQQSLSNEASIVTMNSFPYDPRGMEITARLEMTGVADGVFLGFWNSAGSMGLTRYDNATGAWGAFLDLYNARISIVFNGITTFNASREPDSHRGIETWRVRMFYDDLPYIQVYRGDVLTYESEPWSAASFTADPTGLSFRGVISARTGGYTGTYRVHGTPTYRRESNQWRRLAPYNHIGSPE